MHRNRWKRFKYTICVRYRIQSEFDEYEKLPKIFCTGYLYYRVDEGNEHLGLCHKYSQSSCNTDIESDCKQMKMNVVSYTAPDRGLLSNQYAKMVITSKIGARRNYKFKNASFNKNLGNTCHLKGGRELYN